MIQYRVRIVKSGDYVEVYEYEKPGFKNTLSAAGKAGRNLDDPKEEKHRSAFSVQRARTHIRRLLNANPDFTKFVTLTFARNEQNLDVAFYEFKKFVQRLKYEYGNNLKYLTVIEFQKRGAVHFHSVLDTPYIQNAKLAWLWGNGFVNINQIRNVKNLGAYVSKYLGKETELLKGRKKYFHSRNLAKPREFIEPWFCEPVLDSFQDDELIYKKEFESRYYGKVSYKQFFLRNSIAYKI